MKPFKPDMVPGLAGWWDVADPESVIMSDQITGRVGALLDKSGGGLTLHNRHINPNPPALVEGAINGLPGLDFRIGTYTKLYTNGEGAHLMRATTGGTIISASMSVADASGNILRIAAGNGAGNIRFSQFGDGVGIRRLDNDSPLTYDVGSHPGIGVPVIATSRVDYIESGLQGWINGSKELETADINMGGRSDDTRAREVYIGNSSSGQNFEGYIGEVLFFGRAIDTSEREAVEGYLAHKWGATLAAEHPYYSSPPWVSPRQLSPGLNIELTGNVTKASGQSADLVAIFQWPDGPRVAFALPDANGDWTAMVPQGNYGITYIAEGCQPITHGPYLAEAE